MDSTDFPISRSPRKELQGPRPPALKVRKESHKIRKPPVAPASQASQSQQEQHQQPIYQQPRQPVIIYTVSPKVIHTSPSNFMNLVQRLTGPSPTASSTPPNNPFNDDIGAISPAARFATLEKAARSPKGRNQMLEMIGDVGSMGGIDDMMGQVMEKSTLINPHGILSPGPASLPQISPNFFSQFDPNSTGFFPDFSPVLHGNRTFTEGSFFPSPSTFVSPLIASPSTPSIDLFNNFNNFNNFFDL